MRYFITSSCFGEEKNCSILTEKSASLSTITSGGGGGSLAASTYTGLHGVSVPQDEIAGTSISNKSIGFMLCILLLLQVLGGQDVKLIVPFLFLCAETVVQVSDHLIGLGKLLDLLSLPFDPF